VAEKLGKTVAEVQGMDQIEFYGWVHYFNEKQG
jgi:hypothetical protein